MACNVFEDRLERFEVTVDVADDRLHERLSRGQEDGGPRAFPVVAERLC
jgi:hypothetical protein